MSQHASEVRRTGTANPGGSGGTSAVSRLAGSEPSSTDRPSVVRTTPLVFADLIARARGLVGTGQRRVLLGVTGSPGAGKTTLVKALAAALRTAPPVGLTPHEWIAHIPMDGFHLADVELDKLGLRDRKGAPDTFDGHGYLNLLRRLRADESSVVYAPTFERDLEQPLAGAVAIPPAARLVLTEGNYLLLEGDPWSAVAEELDEVWFVALEDDTRRTRLLARHVAFGKEPAFADHWVQEVDEANARLITASQTRAHLLVPGAVLDEVCPSELREPEAGEVR